MTSLHHLPLVKELTDVAGAVQWKLGDALFLVAQDSLQIMLLHQLELGAHLLLNKPCIEPLHIPVELPQRHVRSVLVIKLDITTDEIGNEDVG